MQIEYCSAKLHRARVTGIVKDGPEYIEIDPLILLAAKSLLPGMMAYANSGTDATHRKLPVKLGVPGSGDIIISGFASRNFSVRDMVIILLYPYIDYRELENQRPMVVHFNPDVLDKNIMVEIVETDLRALIASVNQVEVPPYLQTMIAATKQVPPPEGKAGPIYRVCTSMVEKCWVTEAQLGYRGSITLDPLMILATGMLPYMKLAIDNLRNGLPWETYVIPDTVPGSGKICLNGPPAHIFQKGDPIHLLSYSLVTEEEYKSGLTVNTVRVGEDNQVTGISQFDYGSVHAKLSGLQLPSGIKHTVNAH